MSEIEEIPTVYAEETETSSSDRLPPLHDDTKRRSNHLKPASLKLNYPRRESWTENIAESLTNEVAPPASAPIPAPRRNSAWISDEGEPRSSQLLPPSGTPEGSFVFDRSDGTRSPTPSQTSKRTSISGDFATHMRSKIREQARSVVAKKRGSVQLEKRLARRQTQSTFDEAYSVNEDEEIDAEIEESLALGEKYTSNNEMITYHEQNEFFTGTAPSGGEDEKREKTRASSLVHFVKASPSTVSERLRHATQILYYNKNTEFDETQFMNNESSLLVARPLRDWNIAKQRFGTDFVDSYGHLKGAELMMTRVPLRVERDHDEDRRLLKRSGCVRWGENTSFDRKNLHQLDLRLEKIVFDRHWLFTSEDTLAMDIRKLHDVQKATGENVVRMLKDFITQKKRIMVTNDDETKKLLQANVDRIWAELGNEQSTYAKLGESIEEQWDNLVAERATNSTSVTTLNLEKTYLKPDGFADLGDEMGLFYRTPVYTLTETNPLPEERPLSEKQRFEAIQGTHFLIQIHFNGIPVCKTRSRTLSNEFTVDFNQSYNIKVHDSPHTITLTILERTQNTEYRELAKVGVPLPDQNQLTTPQTPLESVEFASNKPIPKLKNMLAIMQGQGVHGKIFCSVAWAEKGILSVHEKKEKIYSKGRSTYEYDGFHLIPKETRLVSDEEFRSDLRIEALITRSEGRLKGAKALKIPMDSSEIDPQLMLEVDSRATGNGARRWQLAIDAAREEGRKRAVEIRRHLRDRLSKDKRSIRYEDLVREVPIPSYSGFIGSLFGQADTSRKLRPMRKEPSTFKPSTQSGTVQIVINIQSAVNLPHRTDASEVQSFVQVDWKLDSLQTTVAKGSNPSWNETLKIAIPKANKVEWREVTGEIVFSVYDQRVSALESDDREVNTIHEQLNREWIGTAKVPFSTLASMGKFEGTLRLWTPFLSTNHKTNEKPIYIKVLVAFDPMISLPRPEPFSTVESAESESVLKQCVEWTRKLKEEFSRDVVATVTDVVGRATLLCRFLRPIRPPSCVEQLAGNLERCGMLANLVAGSISPLPESSNVNIVVSADQLVNIGFGTALEKATLLCCWLMHLSLDPILLLGTALPESFEAAFVVARVADFQLLLNPNDGFCYRLNDPLVPIISVATAVVVENHFANIQSAQHPSQLSFDLKNSLHWRPLFSARSKPDFTSVQSSYLSYNVISEDVLLELRAGLEREIKVQFDESRRFGIPQWNLSAARTLREILIEFDARDSLPPDIETRLQYLRGSFKTNVIACKLPYTSREDVFQVVSATNFSLNANRNSQFAVAVHISPFFGGVLQISIALAALIPP